MMMRNKANTNKAAALRASVKANNLKVRIAVTGWSYRLIGAEADVVDLCELWGLTTVSGEAVRGCYGMSPHDQGIQLFAYDHTKGAAA